LRKRGRSPLLSLQATLAPDVHQLRGHQVSTHVVTHGHPDHFGSSHAVCEALDVALWTGERDAAAVETARPVPAPGGCRD